MLDSLGRDLKYSLRSLARRPGFALVSTLTLALGIGVTTAIFSVVQSVGLRALPYPEEERLVQIWETKADDPQRRWGTSYSGFRDWVDHLESLEQIGVAALMNPLVLTGDGEPVRLWATFASPSYLRLLGAAAAVGRLFDDGDHRAPDGHPVAIISHRLWQSRYGGADILGHRIELAERDYEIVGVMKAGFVDLSTPAASVDVWLPVMMARQVFPADVFDSRVQRGFTVIGRLRPGRDLAHLEQELASVARYHATEFPDSHGNVGAAALLLRASLLGSFRGPVAALMAGALFLLVVACINVASLMLVRSAGRKRELAVRFSLGATLQQLARQLAVEATILAAGSAVIGLACAAAVLRLMPGISAIGLPAFARLELDGGSILLAATVAVLASLATVLAPELRWRRTDLRSLVVAGGERAGGQRGSHRTASALVILEVATAVVLVIGSGLLVRSFQTLRETGVGFTTQERLLLRVSLPRERYPDPEDAHRAVAEIRHGLGALHAVESVAVWSPNQPGQPTTLTTFVTEGAVMPSQLDAELGRFHQVSPGAIEQLGIRLLRGRSIGAQDRLDSLPVVVLGESLARALWPDENPLGKRLTNWIPPGADPAEYPAYTVVGVVGDVQLGGRTAQFGIPTTHDAYFAHAQRLHPTTRQLVIVLETHGNMERLGAEARRAIGEVDAELAVFAVRPLAEVVAQEEQMPRFMAVLMSGFGALSLALAVVGIYGVLSQAVVARRREIGLRTALGAEPARIVRLFVGYGLQLAVAGLVLGSLAAFGLARFVSSLLFGITPRDPTTFVAAPLILLLAALLACYLPTLRALNVDPRETLRVE